MGNYKISKKTEIDISEFYEYGIATFGLLQAQNYFLEMHQLFKVLAKNNDLGRDASEFLTSLKRFSYKSHTIFYFTMDSGVFIIRVLSQSSDYTRNLQL